MITFASWITLSRLVSIPIVLGLLSWQVTEQTRLWAAVIFGIASLTDWLDGYIARKWQQESDLGKVLDPLVDKLVVMAPLLMFVQMGEVPAWGVFFLLARELLITLWRSPDRSLIIASNEINREETVIGANWWGKTKTVAQVIAVLAILLQVPHGILFFWVAVGLTIFSGVTYVFPISHP